MASPVGPFCALEEAMLKVLARSVLGGCVIAAVSIVAFAPSARAACWWTGLGWSCAPPPQTAYYAHDYQPYYQPYYAGPRWGYNYGDYDQIPNDYPGPALTQEGN